MAASTDLVRGFGELARESCRWAAELEVLLSDSYKDGRPDTVGLGGEVGQAEPGPASLPDGTGEGRAALIEDGDFNQSEFVRVAMLKVIVKFAKVHLSSEEVKCCIGFSHE